MRRIAILLFLAMLACAAAGFSLLFSQQGASADPALSLDSVDIGKNESQAGWPCSAVYSSDETNHSAADWGISVWKACGGNYGFPSQSGDTTARVTWQGLEWDGSGSQVDGTNSPEASVTLTNPAPHQLGTLVIEVLDGQGSNSFDLRVNGTLVYTYHSSTDGGEHWVVHSIDLVNPANSSYVHPNHIDDYYVAGTGIDPCTTTLVIEIENHGPAWSGWYSWGQLAVTYLELFAAEPETICSADVKIVDQDIDAPSQVAVSENVPVTVSKVLHNNGPYGPVEVEVGAVIDSVNIGYDSPACPSPYSADENAHAAEGWGEDVARACTGGNYGGGSDDGNSRLVWYPNELPSGSDREASVTLTNPGFQLGILRTNVLDGQAGSNSFELRVNNTLVYTYHSDPSTAEYWVVHSVDLVNPANSSFDGSTTQCVGSPPTNAPCFIAGTGLDPFTDSLEIEFTVLGDKWSGFDTWGQLAVSWVQLLAGETYQEVLPLPISTEVVVEEQLVIHCSEASTHVFPFENTILRIKDEHVVDSDPTNNTIAGQITVDCIGTANPKIVSQDIDAPSQVAVSENVPVTVSKVLHNNGPYGPVEVEVGAVIDSVNIGYDSPACPSPYSPDETAHAADGWGQDVARACTGGNYGGGSDDGNSRLVWYPNELPSGSDREASVTLTNPGFQLGILRTNVLDGQAGSNSFELRVNNTLVYTYHSDPSTAEYWVVHSVDLVNPANSSFDGSTTQCVGSPPTNAPCFIAGTGIDPFTDSLEIEFTVLGDKWSGFDTWGQLAVSWVQLLAGETYQEVLPLPVSTEVVAEEHLVIHCAEASTHVFPFENTILRIKDEHVVDSDPTNNTMAGQITVDCIGTSDVKITSVDIPDLTSGEASEDKSVTLGAVVHNNGPYGPVATHMRLTFNVAPQCTLRVVFPGYPPMPVPSGVPIDAPISHDLPVSEDLSLSVDLIGHCSVAGLQMFSGCAEVVIDQEHIVDPDPDNNEACTQASWPVYGESDVKIVSQQFVTPPNEIDVSANVPVKLRKVLRNDGPYAEPVEVTISKTATAPADCTINPAAHEEQVVVPYGTNVTVDETFTIHCSKPSSHTFSVTNVVSEPKDPYVIDPDMGNNGPETTSLTVKAIGYSDLKVADQYMENPPAQIPVSQDVTVVLDKVIHNNGTWGPVDAFTTTTVDAPANCTVRPAVHVQQFSDVPVSVDILHHEPFVIHCEQLGEYTFTFDDTVAVKEPHVRDLVSDNNSWLDTELTVEAIGLADVKISSASFVDPPTKIPLGEDVDVTLRKHIHNNGSWGPVDIAISSSASAPTGCTVTPKSVPNSLSGVPVSADQPVDEVWTINCTQDTTLKTFVFNNSISVTSTHVYDPDGANNAVVKYLTVTDDPADPEGDMDGDGWTNGAEAVIGTDPADACPDDVSDDAWPPDVNNDAEVDIFDVLLYKPIMGGLYDSRYDLNVDGCGDIMDVLMYKPVLGSVCTP